MPETVLAELAAKIPGSVVEMLAGKGGVMIHKLNAADGTPLLRVIEPPAGWPVQVTHYHADPTHETTYALCGPGHDPNRPRHTDDPDVKMSAAEWDELEQQKAHTPIDTPEKLKELCASLLESKESKTAIARAARQAMRRAAKV